MDEIERDVPLILPRFYRRQEALEDQRRLARNLLESGEMAPDSLTSAGATAGGDEQRLRGIPAIGRGCPGAIRGSSPHNMDFPV